MKKIDKEKIKTWFVTGASSGVGYEMCKQLLKRGYNVIAVSRRIPDFKETNALCLSVDVTKLETIKNAIKKGIEKFGKIDVLVNNAGISAGVVFEEETLEHMQEVMSINYFGTYNTMREFIPYFRKHKNGTIINNTSMHGLSFRYGGSAYCSSKYAIEGLTSVVWHETKNFCRVMTFELGWFPGTDIGTHLNKITNIEEYKNIKGFYKNFYYSFINQLDIGVKYIIDEVEKEKIQRRLILGKDAIIKIDAEINYLRKNWKQSKRRALNCAKFDKEFPKKVIKKIAKIVLKKQLNI